VTLAAQTLYNEE